MATLTLAKARLEPTHPGQLATGDQLCNFWKAMDVHYSTPANSPLHHDNRCEEHVPVIAFVTQRKGA
jgi:hypothetical protein